MSLSNADGTIVCIGGLPPGNTHYGNITSAFYDALVHLKLLDNVMPATGYGVSLKGLAMVYDAKRKLFYVVCRSLDAAKRFVSYLKGYDLSINGCHGSGALVSQIGSSVRGEDGKCTFVPLAHVPAAPVQFTCPSQDDFISIRKSFPLLGDVHTSPDTEEVFSNLNDMGDFFRETSQVMTEAEQLNSLKSYLKKFGQIAIDQCILNFKLPETRNKFSDVNMTILRERIMVPPIASTEASVSAIETPLANLSVISTPVSIYGLQKPQTAPDNVKDLCAPECPFVAASNKNVHSVTMERVTEHDAARVQGMAPVRELLVACRLEQYGSALENQGYDDFAFLTTLDLSELDELARVVEMKPGHLARLRSHLARLKTAADLGDA